MQERSPPKKSFKGLEIENTLSGFLSVTLR